MYAFVSQAKTSNSIENCSYASTSSSPSCTSLSPPNGCVYFGDNVAPAIVTSTPISHNVGMTLANNRIIPPELPMVLENGRKVFGPPLDYVGERPTHACELFLANIPEQLDDGKFLTLLQRLGDVYEFRLMMNSGSALRGYGFVRFMNEAKAIAACEFLSFSYMNGERLRVYRSQGKSRLYISNIPKELPLNSIKEGFTKMFSTLTRCIAYESFNVKTNEEIKNRGFAFIEFENHESALEAKKRTTPGRIRMWGCDLKVQWAKPKPDSQKFLHKNPLKNGLSKVYSNDYCAKLRLFCLANNWCIPVVVYGRSDRQHGIQYGAVLLRDANTDEYSCMFMEMVVSYVLDVHVLMCEIVTQIVQENCGFPKGHYLVRCWSGVYAKILFTCNDLWRMLNLDLSRYVVNFVAIDELLHGVSALVQVHPEKLLCCYKNSFLQKHFGDLSIMDLSTEQSFAQFYAIFPKFRNNRPLNNNFNDIEITLMQMYDPSSSMRFHMYAQQHKHTPSKYSESKIIHLNSNAMSCFSRVSAPPVYRLKYVDLSATPGNGNSRWFYHPAQIHNSPPIWIRGHSYQTSVFNYAPSTLLEKYKWKH